MRKRKRKRKKNPDPIEQLKSLGQRWRKAVYDENIEAAKSARSEAEKIFKAHPEFRDSQPVDIGRGLYIDWHFFVRFNEEPWRKGYIKAVEENQWPARPIKD